MTIDLLEDLLANGPFAEAVAENPVAEADQLRGGEVILIVGKRGSGKTGMAFYLLEKAHSIFPKRKCYAVGIPRSVKLPKWIRKADKVEKVPNESVVLVEEAGLGTASAYRNWEHEALRHLIQLARHKALTLIFINLNTSTLDINVVRQADTLMLREPSVFQASTERPGIKKLVLQAIEEFAKLPEAERIKHAWVIHARGAEMVATPLPGFWSDKISRSYAKER